MGWFLTDRIELYGEATLFVYSSFVCAATAWENTQTNPSALQIARASIF
jgi:hypothetical protein